MADSQLKIGSNIRTIRMKMGITQQDLANQCDLSKGMISKIENGLVVPAIATLTRIAHALHVKVSALIENENQQPSLFTINPFTNSSNFITTTMGYEIFNPAAGLKDKMMQPILINADQNKTKPHTVSHPGEEYIFVFSGEMNFRVGNTIYLMQRGDSLFFDASQPHGIMSVQQNVQYVDLFNGYHYEAEPDD